jgi:hypothetical protein
MRWRDMAIQSGGNLAVPYSLNSTLQPKTQSWLLHLRDVAVKPEILLVSLQVLPLNQTLYALLDEL